MFFLKLITTTRGVTFTVANLANFPPLSIYNFDVLSVVQDVEALKPSLKQVLDNQHVMADLMTEQIRSTAENSRQEKAAEVARHVIIQQEKRTENVNAKTQSGENKSVDLSRQDQEKRNEHTQVQSHEEKVYIEFKAAH